MFADESALDQHVRQVYQILMLVGEVLERDKVEDYVQVYLGVLTLEQR
jgi:hypothetical protein